jgi:uncharacterized protein (DUF488 family)
MDFLYLYQKILYYTLVTMGVEFVINLGESELCNYHNWVLNKEGRSPIRRFSELCSQASQGLVPDCHISYLCKMFYRRKVILALFQLFDGHLEKIRLQKLLFLFCQKQEKAEYDFVPYKYGCFSYSANADLSTMVDKGLLIENPNDGYRKADKVDYLNGLKPADRELLIKTKAAYGDMSNHALIKHTYLNFPYFAINSIRAPEILAKEELDKVSASKPKGHKTVLYTIGYEGISLEHYLNRLLKNDIKILIDVRNNPLSMKYGFSKSQLKRCCENLGIQYLHLPEVGIQSQQRQELNTQEDYDKLFEVYRRSSLPKTIQTQQEILALLVKNKRIALTCFEANICQCHRKHLAEAIQKLPGFQYEVKHIE